MRRLQHNNLRLIIVNLPVTQMGKLSLIQLPLLVYHLFLPFPLGDRRGSRRRSSCHISTIVRKLVSVDHWTVELLPPLTLQLLLGTFLRNHDGTLLLKLSKRKHLQQIMPVNLLTPRTLEVRPLVIHRWPPHPPGYIAGRRVTKSRTLGLHMD